MKKLRIFEQAFFLIFKIYIRDTSSDDDNIFSSQFLQFFDQLGDKSFVWGR